MESFGKFIKPVEKGGVEVASAIRLGEAYFYLNCEAVTDCSDLCPKCGHSQLWLLQKWIGKIDASKNSSDKEDTSKDVHLTRPLGCLERIL